MQAVVPALHSVGTGVGDVLPIIRPLDFIAPALHLPDEIFLAAADFHCLGHIVHQPELPALALGRDAVLPAAYALAAFLIGRQNRKPMGQTQLVTDGTELLECTGVLPQLSSIHEADRVDHEVGVDVLGIAVGGDLDFVTGPGFHGELSGNLVGLLIGDVLPVGEGLDILVEVDAVQFSVGILGRQELRDRVQSVTTDAADIPLPSQLIHGFAFLQAVPHNTDHSTRMLPGFFDIGYGCYAASPPRLIR